MYAREGAAVLLADISESAVASTKEVIDSEEGSSEVFIGDVTKASDVEAMVAQCVKTYGRVDVLHNNVAIFDMNSLDDISEERWDRFFAVNVKGVLLTCKYALPHMLRQKAGAIVNVSTISSFRYTSPCVAYSASKAAVNQLTQSIAGVATASGAFARTASFRGTSTRHSSRRTCARSSATSNTTRT